MPLPSSGAISISQLNTAAFLPSTTQRALGDTISRDIAIKPSGAVAMSDMYGKVWLPQYYVADWLLTNMDLVTRWEGGGTGVARYVNFPFHRYSTTAGYTHTFDFSGQTIESTWATVVVQLSGNSPWLTSIQINGGSVAIADSYVGTTADQLQMCVYHAQVDFKTITTVSIGWNLVYGNRTSVSCVRVLPGKWDTFTEVSMPVANPSVVSCGANSIHIATGHNGGIDGAVTFITGAPASNAAYNTFDNWWYNNAQIGMAVNAADVPQNFSYDNGAFYGRVIHFTGMSVG